MWEVFVLVFFMLYVGMSYGIWNEINRSLENYGPSYYEPHVRSAAIWWAENGLWQVLWVTILTIIIVIAGLAIKASRDARAERERREMSERRRNVTSMESTEFETELRRRLNEDLR